MSYILVTPILNESGYLAKLKESVLNQTIKPLIWVIGDGDSHDGSYELAKGMFKEYEWIHVIKQKTFSGQGFSHQNFSNNINDCYEYATKVCKDKNIHYSYIGKTDATPILSINYFEVLLKEMEKDSKLAMVCGLQYFKHNSVAGELNDKRAYEFIRGVNDIKLYRREFFESMGGYPVEYAPDTILVVKAINRGWNVHKTYNTYFIKPRRGGTKIGYWAGYQLKGRGMYILNYHPLLALLNALYISKYYPHYLGLGLMYGYIASFIENEKQITDKETTDYFWSTRLKEVFKGSLWVCM